MNEAHRGLYEVLVTEALAVQLRRVAERFETRTAELRSADAADRIAFHLERLIRRGIASVPKRERADPGLELAKGLIEHRQISILFSIDLFNEGVDLPTVDTLLLLRPTDSPTLFLQQLGRGLRRSSGKTACTVLDFVGRHRGEFRFDRRFRALLGGSRRDPEDRVSRGFPFLPAGCHLELDPVARDEVRRGLRSGVPSRWTPKVEDLRHLARNSPATPASYLQETGLDLEDVYTGQRSWSDLKADAGLPLRHAGPHEGALRRACGRLLHVDDVVRTAAWRRMLLAGRSPDVGSHSVREERLLVSSIFTQALAGGSETLAEGPSSCGTISRCSQSWRSSLQPSSPAWTTRGTRVPRSLRGSE